eukprot:8703177-Pyramimonas_sp.AAC.1
MFRIERWMNKAALLLPYLPRVVGGKAVASDMRAPHCFPDIWALGNLKLMATIWSIRLANTFHRSFAVCAHPVCGIFRCIGQRWFGRVGGRTAHGREELLGRAVLLEHGLQHLAVVDLDAYVLGGDAHVGEEGCDGAQQLRLRLHAIHPDDVHVPLVVLTAPPARHALVPGTDHS